MGLPKLTAVLERIRRRLTPPMAPEPEGDTQRAYQALAASGAHLPIPTLSPRLRVLINPMVAGSPLFVLREGILGHALRLRGADVVFLLCDEALPTCDARALGQGVQACGSCFSHGSKRYDWLGLNTVRLSTFLTPSLRADLHARSRECPVEELFTTVYRDHPVGSYVYSSTLRHFLAGQVDLTNLAHQAKARDYLQAGMLMVEAARAALDELAPDRVLTSHGIYVSWAPLLHEARRRKIPIVTFGPSYRRNTLRFCHNEPTAPMPAGLWPHYRDRPLTPEQEVLVDRYILSRRSQKEESVPVSPDESFTDPALERWLAARADGKVFGLFTNVAWDAVAFSSEKVFNDMLAWVEATVRYFADRPRHRLLVKVHPAELRGTEVTPEEHRVGSFLQRRFPQLPKNIFLLGPECLLSPYALYDRIDAGLTHISTVTLEMALGGITVLTSGARGHYAGHGFTLDPESEQDYFTRLQGLMDGTESFRPDVEIARRYLYFRFFREAMPFDFLDVQVWNPQQLKLHSLEELLPGRNRPLDIICEGVMRGTPIVMDEQ